MLQDSQTSKDSIVNVIELYISKWKFILACIFASLLMAFIIVRYSTYEYQANATIKLKEDENSRSLAEITSLQNGMLGSNLPSITDEIEIIKSRTIIKEVVKDLKLNIKYFINRKIEIKIGKK